MTSAYRVPSMTEIEALPWNGLTVASTFSGAGGSCLGYRMAGFRVAYAAEFIESARDTYKANHPNSYLDPRDVREIKGSEILEIVGGQVDILDGSPPCASFSTSGARDAGWGKVKAYSDGAQRTDDLFDEYIRLVGEIQPRAFVAENVSGLVKGTAKGYFIRVMKALKSKGYRVECRVLDASWLGVPQSRQRTIFVGVREDLGRSPTHPDPWPSRYTVRDVLPHVREVKHSGKPNNWKPSTTPNPTIVASGGAVSPTAYMSGGSFIRTMDGQVRRYNLDEVRLLSGFPADFVLRGSFEQQWERLGRAVPPLMMREVAATLRDKVLT
jgi:DNA (cytosine-5)-methyltransferase 1